MADSDLDEWMTYGDHRIAFHKRTKQMYVNGEPVMTEKRFAAFERGLAVAGLVIAGIGVAATVVQAWAAISPPQTTNNFQRCMDQHQFILGDAFNDRANRAKALDTCLQRAP